MVVSNPKSFLQATLLWDSDNLLCCRCWWITLFGLKGCTLIYFTRQKALLSSLQLLYYWPRNTLIFISTFHSFLGQLISSSLEISYQLSHIWRVVTKYVSDLLKCWPWELNFFENNAALLSLLRSPQIHYAGSGGKEADSRTWLWPECGYLVFPRCPPPLLASYYCFSSPYLFANVSL